MFAAVKLYTSLEDANNDGNDAKLDIETLGKAQLNDDLKGINKKNILARLERQVKKRLFILNHIILTNQAVSVPLYHIIFFLTFIQILFNIFYKVEITNEFAIEPILSN